MVYLVAGLIVFFAAHAVPSAAGFRAALVKTMGLWGYRAAFTLVSGAGLAAMVFGYANADKEMLWAPMTFARHLAYSAVPLALCLIAAAYTGSNIKRRIVHPMPWGIAIWATVHLLNNGDLPSVLLFGSFLLYAVLEMLSANRRGATRMTARVPAWRDGLALVIGLGAAGLIAHFHGTLFGVSIMP